MPEKKFVVKHHLDQLSAEELVQYLQDVSTYIGLDPDLNGLDTLWMDNESGVGRSLVVYAKRGTAEILRYVYNVDVQELTHAMVGGSIVFTAAGRGGRIPGNLRTERAVGSKYIKDLVGKPLDNGIMTASTRALRRLTMQFTTLGILDESEVVDFVGQPVNAAAGAQLAGSPVVIPPQPQVAPNNEPGRVLITDATSLAAAASQMLPVSQDPRTQAQVATVIALREIEKAAAAEAPTPTAPPAEKVKKPRKSKNTVSLEVEPEVVNNAPAEPVICVDCKTPLSGHPLVNSVRTCPVPIQTVASTNTTPVNAVSVNAPPPVPVPPPVTTPAADMPTKEQMDEYRKKIGAFTQQLPATPGLGSVQRMRAFITKMFNAAPQNLNAAQWVEVIAWFDDFSTRNGVKGLLKFINDTLGDVPKS